MFHVNTVRSLNVRSAKGWRSKLISLCHFLLSNIVNCDYINNNIITEAYILHCMPTELLIYLLTTLHYIYICISMAVTDLGLSWQQYFYCVIICSNVHVCVNKVPQIIDPIGLSCLTCYVGYEWDEMSMLRLMWGFILKDNNFLQINMDGGWRKRRRLGNYWGIIRSACQLRGVEKITVVWTCKRKHDADWLNENGDWGT